MAGVLRLSLALACSFWATTSAIHVTFPAQGSWTTPKYVINLDLPPRQRWKHIVRDYREYLLSIADRRVAAFQLYPADFVHKMLAAQYVDKEYVEEIQGIVEEVADPRITLELTVFGHMKYELGLNQEFGCSGIVAAMENGTMVQGRNLDLSSTLSYGKPGMIEVDFKKGGETVISAPTFVGLVGFHTALRTGGWSLQQNTRDFGTHSRETWYQQVLESARLGGRTFLLESRNILMKTQDFDTAVKLFQTTPWSAPQYWILAGHKPYQGAVITVGRAMPQPLESFVKTELLDPAHGVWFLTETNDDNWNPTDDPRRGVAQQTMISSFAMVNQEHNLKRAAEGSVWNAMRVSPVCNEDTWLTWMAVPSKNATRLTTKPCPTLSS